VCDIDIKRIDFVVFCVKLLFCCIQKIEQPTLKEFLELVGNAVHVGPNVVIVSASRDNLKKKHHQFAEFYPSVDFGPISCVKAVHSLKWKPTPLSTAIEQTVKFFTWAWYKYPNLRPLHQFSEDMKQTIISYYQTNKSHLFGS
jgi:hypothetical protein